MKQDTSSQLIERDKYGSITHPNTLDIGTGTAVMCLWCDNKSQVVEESADGFRIVQHKKSTGRFSHQIVSQWKCNKCFPE